jgi:hypothetical protein
VKTLDDNANMQIINVKLTIDATLTFIEGSLGTLCCRAYLQISARVCASRVIVSALLNVYDSARGCTLIVMANSI